MSDCSGRSRVRQRQSVSKMRDQADSTLFFNALTDEKRLPIEMIKELVRHSGKQLTERLPEQWKWKGRDVMIVDGTTLSMPDTPQNQRDYPQPNTQQPGCVDTTNGRPI